MLQLFSPLVAAFFTFAPRFPAFACAQRMAVADAVCVAALRGATLADVLAHRAAAAPDRRRVLLLEHSMTVAEALQVRRARSMRHSVN
jgi:hypothetical protein